MEGIFAQSQDVRVFRANRGAVHSQRSTPGTKFQGVEVRPADGQRVTDVTRTKDQGQTLSSDLGLLHTL